MRSTRWANRWAENCSALSAARRFSASWVSGLARNSSSRCRNSTVLWYCQPFSPSRMTPLQAEIRPAQGGHAGGQCLDVGQTLGLAGGGADEQVPQPVPLRHLLRGAPCRQRSLPGPPAADRGPPAPAGAGQDHPPPATASQGGCPGEARSFSSSWMFLLLLRKAPHAHQHSVFRRDAQAGPQNRPAHGIALLLEAPQVDARRHHEDRAANAIALQQSPHLAGGGRSCRPPGQLPSGRKPPPHIGPTGRWGRSSGCSPHTPCGRCGPGGHPAPLRCGGPGKRC